MRKVKYPKMIANLAIGFLPLDAGAKEMIRDIAEATWDIVQDFTGHEFREMEGAAKASAVVREVAEWATKAFEDVPLWGGMSEERQRLLISGLSEWAYFAIDLHHQRLAKPRRKVKRPRAKKVRHD